MLQKKTFSKTSKKFFLELSRGLSVWPPFSPLTKAMISLDFDTLDSPIVSESGLSLQGTQIDAFYAAEYAAKFGGVFFLTGRAGTGKSAVISTLRERMVCMVVAPTGLAALNVGGATIHSQFGIKPGAATGQLKKLPEDFAELFYNIDLLIIDEVSMVRADLLDTVDKICRMVAGNERPFGGKGTILVGDFWQIEPVVQAVDKEWLSAGGYISPFAFHSRVWKNANPRCIELTKIWRQSDATFIDALNTVRTGGVDSLPVFNSRVAEPEADTLRLVMTNARAKEINLDKLAMVTGREWSSTAAISGDFCDKEAPVDMRLTLKIGCRVMVTRNGNGVVNGDMGVVTGFYTNAVQVALDSGMNVVIKKNRWKKVKTGMIVELDDDGNPHEVPGEIETGAFSQYPLKLAYAVTAHKSQGQTFDRVHLELDRRSFAHGLTYVSLSRSRTLEGLSLGRELRPSDVTVSPIVASWNERMFGPKDTGIDFDAI